MNGSFLLDTNIIVALFAEEPEVLRSFARANEIIVPSIVIGELCYGARKSGRPQENLARVDRLVSAIPVLECDLETAYCYGEIKNRLRLRGRPLPENDIWIAALAVQYDLTLVTRDQHFQEIEALQKVVW